MENKATSVYRYPWEYANEMGEALLYRESMKANVECARLIERAVSQNYRMHPKGMGGDFDPEQALKAVMEEFSLDRIVYVLANTVRYKLWDGRFSDANKRWAQSVSVCVETNKFNFSSNSRFVVDKCHSVLTNAFINHVRKQLEP